MVRFDCLDGMVGLIRLGKEEGGDEMDCLIGN